MTSDPPRWARTAPPLLRGSMTPSPWFGFWRGLLFALWPGQRWPADARPTRPWHAVARRRRAVLIALVTLLASSALALRLSDAPADADAWWWATTALMTGRFAWVGIGCATAMVGAWALWRGDPHAPRLARGDGAIDAQARTAIIMPICNEDIAEVFAGLRATCESLAATGRQQLFDVFVLSDTSNPALREAEQRAFVRLRAMLGEPEGEGSRLFYRWRRRRTKRKAGNVADFCRRWGRRYRYMVVLDADSTMSGDALVDLVRLMEQHPHAGIIQTLPQVARPATLHARAQQFASRVSGRLFALGMSWWQLGDAHYWGHNAIIRVAPFMQHCGLAKLPGRGGLAGEIMSHDFVEAALLGRAGFEVWLVSQLEGSWEQTPSNLLDELQRDRRWCQGNLQNARLVAEPGWRAAHRVMFTVGALAILGPGESDAFGGPTLLLGGTLLELLLSSLQAPLRMLAHCVFVLGALTGLRLDWKSPPRAAQALAWSDALRRVGSLVLLPLAVGWGVMRRTATVALAPMLLPLTLAVPFTVLTGHPRAGRAVARLGLLRTPEEWRPPQPLVRAGESAAFADLVPIAAPPTLVTRLVRPWRALSAASMAAVAMVTLAMPLPGVAPELPPALRAAQELDFGAYWRDVPTTLPPILAEAPAPRKRVAMVRERPARMIDDALRQRALESVGRSLATPASPPI
jgi:membrane glycosyltransferase